MMPEHVQRVKVSEAQAVWCPECDRFLTSPYWEPSKVLGMHRYGCPDHRAVPVALR